MLDQVNKEFVVAKQLAAMADTFGFDGWLLNIELEFPQKQPTEKICAFIRSLKQLGPEKNIVWCECFSTWILLSLLIELRLHYMYPESRTFKACTLT